MAWEIIENLMVGGVKYTWNFPTTLKNWILSNVISDPQSNPSFQTNAYGSMHDYNIVPFPFVNHYGSDGNWQTQSSVSIGNASYEVLDINNGARIHFSNSQTASAGRIDNSNGTIVYFFMCDHSTQRAAMVSIRSAWYLSGDMNKISFYGYNTAAYYSICYNDIVNAIPPTYNWQSVPSISGKNGILNLSTLNDINDGEPVETSDTSKFILTDDSNVSALVAAHFSQ